MNSESSASDRLVRAIEAGDPEEALRVLAAEPAAAAARSARDVSALLLALYRGQTDVVTAIHDARETLDVFEAAALGDLEALRRCLLGEPGSIARQAPDGFFPLHLAAFFARNAAARVLLAHGADTESVAANATRVRPLHSAAASRSAQAVALLLGAGAEPDARQEGGYTALQSGALHGNVAMLRVLLAHGADPSLRNDAGRTAADLASDGGHDEAAALLERESR